MALMNCPACQKRMSTKASSCPHCQFVLSGEPEQVEESARRQRERARRRLQMHSMIAMTLFAAGALMVLMGSLQTDGWQNWVGRSVLLAGFGFYVVTRVRILMFNRQKK